MQPRMRFRENGGRNSIRPVAVLGKTRFEYLEEGAYDLLGDCVPCVTLGKFVPLGRLHDWTERYKSNGVLQAPSPPPPVWRRITDR